MWQFREAVRGVGEACKGLTLHANSEVPLPVVSGNVSLYNQSNSGLAGTAEVSQPDLPAFRTEINAVCSLVEAGLVQSAHYVSDGGIAFAIIEMCIGQTTHEHLGANIAVPEELSHLTAREFLFCWRDGLTDFFATRDLPEFEDRQLPMFDYDDEPEIEITNINLGSSAKIAVLQMPEMNCEDAAGFLILQIEPHSPAEKAGLNAYDVITSIDGIPITNKDTIDRLVYEAKVGRELSYEIIRDKKVKTGTIILEEAQR